MFPSSDLKLRAGIALVAAATILVGLAIWRSERLIIGPREWEVAFILRAGPGAAAYFASPVVLRCDAASGDALRYCLRKE
jgi:hypothetical protein